MKIRQFCATHRHLHLLTPFVLALFCAIAACRMTGPDQSGARVSFGVVADIQYGDKKSNGEREYRESLNKLAVCVSNLNARDLDFVVVLGDLIDGYKKNMERSRRDFDFIFPLVRQFRAPLQYTPGNHCLLAGRDFLTNRFSRCPLYYDFTLDQRPGWRFIIVDGNDGGPGIVSREQLDWLAGRLRLAAEQNERVFCFCHYPLVQPPYQKPHRLSNSETVLAVLRGSPVVAWFAGHNHSGGYVEQNGIHHVNVRGMVEAPDNSFAIVEVDKKRIVSHGFGNEPTRKLSLPAASRSPAMMR